MLSGGGARGAYQAGIVGALAASAGIADGTPLPPYDLVCGTSIGALNGWFVATAQYLKLRELWYGISAQQIIRLKPGYEALRDPESGLLNRAASAVRLFGLTRNQSAVLQTEPVYDWIERNVDPSVPLAMPLVWAVTNLTKQRPEYFFVNPDPRSAAVLERVTGALRISLGPQTVVREATPDLLRRALLASAAIPIAFDPVEMPGPDGSVNEYCDGGVASNSPVGVAHAIARAADVILLDPPFEGENDYDDAVAVAFAAFGTIQRKLLEVEMRNAYFQSMGRRALARLTPAELGASRAAAGRSRSTSKACPKPSCGIPAQQKRYRSASSDSVTHRASAKPIEPAGRMPGAVLCRTTGRTSFSKVSASAEDAAGGC